MARGFEKPPWWAVILIVVSAVVLAVWVPFALTRRDKEPLSQGQLDQMNAAASAAAASESAALQPPPLIAHLRQARTGTDIVVDGLGSSLTAGAGASGYDKTWIWAMGEALGRYEYKVDLRNHGLGGHAIQAIRDQALQPTIDDQPAIVFFEPGDPNNYAQDVPVDKAGKLTTQTVDDLRAALPNAYIVGILASPIADGNKPNGVDATYQNYIDQTRTSLAGADVVCDVYSTIPSDQLGNLLADGIHPSDTGQQAWISALRNCLKL